MNTIEAETVEEQAALAIREPNALTKSDRPLTAQELRVQEVNEALLPAYQKASTLELSKEEIEGLQEPFPDEVVEIRPHDGLIFIPHIHISNRLNKVLNPGKWSLVKRHHWLEGNTLYGEYVLLIRGCYVGESVGGHPYQPNNPKVNYSDTLESTAAEALRRIAGKRLSCGSQVWDPEYARRWCEKHAMQVNGKWQRRFDTKPNAQTPPPASANATQAHRKPADHHPATPAQPAANGPKEATKATRDWMVAELSSIQQDALQYFIEAGIILPNETLEHVPLSRVPTTRTALAALRGNIEKFKATGKAEKPKPGEPQGGFDFDAKDAPWRTFPVPFGKNAGVILDKLPKNTLFGFWANYKVETEYNGKPLAADKVAKNQAFRDALDEAGKHYEFTNPDE